MCSRDMDRWIHFNMAIVGDFLVVLRFLIIMNSLVLRRLRIWSLYLQILLDTGCEFLCATSWCFYLYVCIITDGDLTEVYKAASSLCQSFIDAMAALIVAFLPSDLNDFIALYPLYFAMAIQWCSFKGGDGFTCSTIFLRITYVSLRHLWQNIFAVKILTP